MNEALEKIEKDYLNAETALENAEKAFLAKQEEFNKMKTKYEKRMCKELMNLFHSFYGGITHSDTFYNAFQELHSLNYLGINCDEVLFDDFEDIKICDSYFVLIQYNRVGFEKYEHKTFIPSNIPFSKIKEVLDKYLEKEKELLQREAEINKAKRYKQYLELKKEFEKEESPT